MKKSDFHVGSAYKTRAGFKFICVDIDEDEDETEGCIKGYFPSTEDEDEAAWNWDEDGTSSEGEDMDILMPWVDELDVEPEEIQAKVGEIWLCKDGSRALIVEHDKTDESLPWRVINLKDDDDNWHDKFGIYPNNLEYALVKKVTDPALSFKGFIAVGQVWLNIYGHRVTIEEKTDEGFHYRNDENDDIYEINEDGRYEDDEPTGHDLFELISNPELKEKPKPKVGDKFVLRKPANIGLPEDLAGSTGEILKISEGGSIDFKFLGFPSKAQKLPISHIETGEWYIALSQFEEGTAEILISAPPPSYPDLKRSQLTKGTYVKIINHLGLNFSLPMWNGVIGQVANDKPTSNQTWKCNVISWPDRPAKENEYFYVWQKAVDDGDVQIIAEEDASPSSPEVTGAIIDEQMPLNLERERVIEAIKSVPIPKGKIKLKFKQRSEN